MARSADFRLDSGFYSHPKIRRLHAGLGAEGVLSWILILAHASQYKTNGRFTGMSDDEIALSAHCAGDSGKFIQTLVELRLLDRRGKTLSLHDWDEHNGYAASYSIRSERARKAAETRWDKKRGDAQRNGGQSGSNAQASDLPKHSSGNPPSPSPDPKPKTQKGKKASASITAWPWPEGEPAPNWWIEKANAVGLDPATEWELWRSVALSHDDMKYSNWKQASIGRLIREGKKQPDRTRANGLSHNGKAPAQPRDAAELLREAARS
jgi:hypothetical protein